MRRRRAGFLVDGLGEICVRPAGKVEPHEAQMTFSGRGIETLTIVVYWFELPGRERSYFRNEATWQGTPITIQVRGKRKRKYFEIQLVNSLESLEYLSASDRLSLCVAITDSLNELLALPIEPVACMSDCQDWPNPCPNCGCECHKVADPVAPIRLEKPVSRNMLDLSGNGF